MAQQSAAKVETNNLKRLIPQTIASFVFGVIALGVLVFLPAWTFNYWQGWVLIVLFMGLVNVTGLYFSIKDPALMERRKQAGPAAEQSTGQKIFITFTKLSNLVLVVISTYEHHIRCTRTAIIIRILAQL